MSLWTLIKSGGWVMFPLLICSIAVWGVVLERFWTLKNWKEKNRGFLLSFSNSWLRGDIDAARKLSEKSDTTLANLALELFATPSTSKNFLNDKLIRKVERRRLEASSEMKKFLWILGTIGSASPFIGLFGTVVGIIRSFVSMSEAGSGGFAVVAGGISEALIATAGGILVAVIAVFFYNYFQVKISQMQFNLKLMTEEMLEVCETKGTSQ